jgi:hypothetical protein
VLNLSAFSAVKSFVFLQSLGVLAGLSPTSAEMTLAKMQRRQPPVYPLHWWIVRLCPPDKNVISADRSLASACHFGGKCAKSAKFVHFVHHLQHLQHSIKQKGRVYDSPLH